MNNQIMKNRTKYKIKTCRAAALFAATFISSLSLSAVNNTVSASEAISETQQQATTPVIGVVLEEGTNDPLIGVSVMVKGTTIGTMTDVDGRFVIDMPYADASLVVSYIGFQSLEVKPGGKKEISVFLKEDSKALQEVVVVGHTKQRKETLIGSIATITTKDLKQSPTANINNALAGRLPGLVANQYAGGEPGVDKSEIFIRGKSTYGQQSPIVIVDGVERDMTYLAPEEIESLTILKDASATAQYGIRGANGVIVITTKRGKNEKPSVNFKASTGISSPIKFPDYLGSADYAMLYNEAMHNDALMNNTEVNPTTLFSDDAISKFRRAKGDNSDGLGYNWDYYDLAFKDALQQDYNLSIRGGSDIIRYYVMANYFKQGGNFNYSDNPDYDAGNKFDRYNFRTNVDINLTRHWTVRLDLGARITERNGPATSAGKIMTLAATQAPYLPIYVEQNSHMQNEQYIEQNPRGMLYGDQLNRYNIIGELNRTGYLNEKNTHLDGTFAMGLDLSFLLEGLKIEGLFAYDASEGRWIRRQMGTYKEGYKEFPNYATFEPVEGSSVYMNPGHYLGAYKSGNKYTIDQTLNQELSHNASDGRSYFQGKIEYNNTFNDLHEVTGMLLGNRSTRRVNDQLAYHYQGVTGRLAYYFDRKYLAEFNFGLNGSENFAPGNRYGFFPAGSIGWVVSNESFMKSSSSWLDMLKVRLSYGLVGNDSYDGSRFPYLSFYGSGSGYNFGNNFDNGLSGLNEGGVPNPDLQWEKAKKFNAGIDLTMLKQRLSISIDAFHENRYDIITKVSDRDADIIGNPTIAGLGDIYVNLGQVYNHGVDVEVSWNDKIGRDFRYYIKPNLTFSRNKQIYKAEIDRKNSWSRRTDKRLYENFVYVFDHFVKDQAEADRLNEINYQPWGTLIPGDAVYKDLDRNGLIDDDDRTAMGHPRSPELMFGIPLGVQYKDFDFSLLFQGAANSSILLNGAAVYDFPQFDQDKIGKVKSMHLQRWTPETASTAKYPALHYGTHDNNKNSESSLFLYDAKYLRLKSVEIGYNLPHKLLRKIGLQQVRFYVQGLNLLTWDGLDDIGIDPETKSGNGAEWYPIQKVYNFGVDITF